MPEKTLTGEPGWLTRVPLVVALATAVALVCLTTAAWRYKSVTFDEAVHLMAGRAYWATGDFHMNPEHPPLAKLLASASMALFAPPVQLSPNDENWLLGDQYAFGKRLLLQGGPDKADRRIRMARFPMALLAGLGSLFAFFVGRRLWGSWGGVVAAMIFVANPTILAHASLVTTDVPLSVFLLLTIWALWDLIEKPEHYTRWKSVAVGGALGLAMASKYNAVFLIPAVCLVVLGDAIGLLAQRSKDDSPPRCAARSSNVAARETVLSLIIVIATAAIVCIAFYLWPPKVWAYWKGLLMVNLNHNTNYLKFFWGQYSVGQFFWYCPACLLLKTPVAALALIGLAIACLRRFHWRRVTFLLIPTLCLLVPTMPMADNIGVRYAIPVWTLLAVLAGVLGSAEAPWPVLRAVSVPLLLALCWASTIWSFPNYIPYFNELSGGSEGGIRYLDDSNIDWGQEIPAAMKYLAICRDFDPRVLWFGNISPIDYGAHAIDMNPRLNELYFPMSTTYLISAHWLDRPFVPWLRWFKPAHRINGSVYVYVFRLTDSEPSHFDPTDGINIVNERDQYLRALHELETSPYIDKGEALNPMRSFGLKHLGEVCLRMGRYEEALQAFGLLKQIPGSEFDGVNGEAAVKHAEALKR